MIKLNSIQERLDLINKPYECGMKKLIGRKECSCQYEANASFNNHSLTMHYNSKENYKEIYINLEIFIDKECFADSYGMPAKKTVPENEKHGIECLIRNHSPKEFENAKIIWEENIGKHEIKYS